MGFWDSLFGRTPRTAPLAPPPAALRSALSPETLAAVRAVHEALAPWRQAHARTAWRPEVHDGEGAPADSRFGGLPWLPEGQVHPVCGRCERPLRMLLQLDYGALPPEAQERLGACGLLQAFYCETEACESEADGWAPFSRAHHVRVVDPGPGRLAAPVGHPFKPWCIVGWERFTDLPDPEEHAEEGLHVDHDFEADTTRVRCPEVGLEAGPLPLEALEAEELAEAQPKDKLLGWPHWVQGVEYPSCPRCGARMELVFQLDSEDHLPLMWGDAGVAHVTRCRAHPDVLTLAWACS